jgi:hypothetical protein
MSTFLCDLHPDLRSKGGRRCCIGKPDAATCLVSNPILHTIVVDARLRKPDLRKPNQNRHELLKTEPFTSSISHSQTLVKRSCICIQFQNGTAEARSAPTPPPAHRNDGVRRWSGNLSHRYKFHLFSLCESNWEQFFLPSRYQSGVEKTAHFSYLCFFFRWTAVSTKDRTRGV